jgi:F-type H+-transporting ATPase subunit gamma
MKALAAVSIRQYERATQSLAVYYWTIEFGLHVLLRDTALQEGLPNKSAGGGLGAIVFGSDQGLCGRFNEDIAAFALQRIEASPAHGYGHRVLAIGNRTAGSLEYLGQSPLITLPTPSSAQHITNSVQQVLLIIDEWQSGQRIEHVQLFYHRQLPKGGQSQPTGLQLLPVNLHRFRRLREEPWPSRSRPTYTLERGQLLTALLRQYFAVTLFRAFAESLASEHTSRLTAMQAADKNLKDNLEEVVATYHRLRQDAITGELLDVVSGFEALTAGR